MIYLLALYVTVSYSINECNFNSVKWELGDKKVQKNVHMVYEHPLFISKKKKCEKVCTKKNQTHISVRGWIRTHRHCKMLHLSETCALLPRPRHRVVNSAIILVIILDVIQNSKQKRLAQASASSQKKIVYLWSQYYIWTTYYRAPHCAMSKFDTVASHLRKIY